MLVWTVIILALSASKSILNTEQFDILQRVAWLSIYRLYDNHTNRRAVGATLSKLTYNFACPVLNTEIFCTFIKPKSLTYRLKFGIILLRDFWGGASHHSF